MLVFEVLYFWISINLLYVVFVIRVKYVKVKIGFCVIKNNCNNKKVLKMFSILRSVKNRFKWLICLLLKNGWLFVCEVNRYVVIESNRKVVVLVIR